MSYKVVISPRAERHISEHERAGRSGALKKIRALQIELELHPRVGTGKPERLRHMLGGEFWSRRIDEKHRLVYEIRDDRLIVIAISAAGHYQDK